MIFCKRCAMNGSAQDIVLTNEGCNFCERAKEELNLIHYGERLSSKSDFIQSFGLMVAKIKTRKDKYDCLIGLSGGVDSSMVLHHAVKLGLKPLCFSVDNGWQDDKAQENIMKLVEGLKVPYYRYNIDLDKFRELQSAFMRAGLINVEIPTDHILMATTLELASRYKIKWILSGGNVATESIMPPSWSYNARDLTHIKDVYKKMTGKRLKGLPVCGLLKWNYYRWVKRIKTIYLLDYLHYNRDEAIALLEKEYGYVSYGEKHEESIFTKWFQNFYLFTKFGIDKRIAHYSSLIMSGQMTRGEAMFKLTASPVYPQLGIEPRVLGYPKRSHAEFKQDKWYERIAKIVKWLS